MLLRDMGKAGLALIVMGTAACASAGSDPTGTTPGDKPTTVGGDDPTTVGSGPASTSVASTTTGAGEGHAWHRVNLGFVSAYILYRNGEATIVDTGVDGSAMSIESGLETIGLGWGDVSGLILTHKHPDHQGSVEGVLAATSDGLPWFAGAADIEAITAPTPGQAVGDGDTVDGALQIIETPGHTPGHISVLDPVSGILVTGDALNGGGDGVLGPDPGFSDDIDLANASVAKLAGFDYVSCSPYRVPIARLAAAQALILSRHSSEGGE